MQCVHKYVIFLLNKKMQCILNCFWDENYTGDQVKSIFITMIARKLKIGEEWTMCNSNSKYLFRRCLKEFKIMIQQLNIIAPTSESKTTTRDCALVKLWSLIAMIHVGPITLMT